MAGLQFTPADAQNGSLLQGGVWESSAEVNGIACRLCGPRPPPSLFPVAISGIAREERLTAACHASLGAASFCQAMASTSCLGTCLPLRISNTKSSSRTKSANQPMVTALCPWKTPWMTAWMWSLMEKRSKRTRKKSCAVESAPRKLPKSSPTWSTTAPLTTFA